MSLELLRPTGYDGPLVATNMLAPDFEIACDDDGGTRHLSDFRGHPVVLAFQQGRWDPTRNDQVDLFNRLMCRFLGPGHSLVRLSRDGLWCHLDFDDREEKIPVLAPLSPLGEVASTYGVSGANAVFVVGSDGLIRWQYVCDASEARPSAEVLFALAQFAPVLQARQRRGTITDRDCAATMLAASALCWAGARRSAA